MLYAGFLVLVVLVDVVVLDMSVVVAIDVAADAPGVAGLDVTLTSGTGVRVEAGTIGNGVDVLSVAGAGVF